MAMTELHGRQPPLVMPGGLVMLGAFWMIGSWLVALGPRTPVQPSAATFEPGVRLMLICVGVGLFIAWPLMRLSQQRPAYPARQTLLDVAVLLSMVQLVIWLPRVLTVWSISRTGALAVLLIGWVRIISSLEAVALSTQRIGPRNLAMLACLAICLAGPFFAWMGGLSSDGATAVVQAGPLLGIQVLTEGGSTRPAAAPWQGVLIVGAAGLAAWIVVSVRALIVRR